MIRKNKALKALVGLFCLPTSTSFHLADPTRSGAFQPGVDAFLLGATQSVEDGGYPPFVVLTAEKGTLDLDVGADVATQHAQVRKNLPPRRVLGILRADGSIEGDLSAAPRGVGFPHWSLIPATAEGTACTTAMGAVVKLIEENRRVKAEEKEALRNLKKAAKIVPSISTKTA